MQAEPDNTRKSCSEGQVIERSTDPMRPFSLRGVLRRPVPPNRECASKIVINLGEPMHLVS